MLRMIEQRPTYQMTAENQFQFNRSSHLTDVMLLKAHMTDFTYGKHAHEEYSFGVTLSGQQEYFTAGAHHSSQPGNIMVFNPGQVHDGHVGGKQPLDYSMLYIHPNQLEPMLGAAGIQRTKNFQISDALFSDSFLQKTILRLAYSLETQSVSKVSHEGLLYELAVGIAKRYGKYEANALCKRVDPLLRQAKDYILHHLFDDLSLAQIAAQACMSKYHFLRLFRQQYGLTPHQFVLNARINQSKNALEQGLALTDVALTHGFSDLSHFNRRFKPVFGMTPKQYQQSLNKPAP